MARRNIIKFAVLSIAVHIAILAPWPAPAVPKFRTATILSVGFAAQTPSTRPAAIRSASKPTAKTTSPKEIKTKALKSKRHLKTTAKPKTSPPPTHVAQHALSRSNKTNKPRLKLTPGRKTITKKTPSTPVRVTAQSKVRARMDQRDKNSIDRTKAGVTSKLVVAWPWEPGGSVRHYTPPTLTRASSAGRTARSSPQTNDVPTRKTTKRSVESASGAVGSTNTSKMARARIRGRLKTDLSHYFWYPAVARRLGWQGSVRIRFRIEPDGRLTNVRVAQGSGYAVLDESAIQALRKVSHLPEAPVWLEGRAIDIELPVIYRLEEH